MIHARGFERMVMGMQPIQIPEFPKLRGEEAIQVLHDFMRELKEQRGKNLTDRQTTALIKFSLGLISSIETENRSNQIMNNVGEKIRGETRPINRLRQRTPFQRFK